MSCAAMQTLITKQAPPTQIICSVILIVLGCIVAGMGDLTFDFMGYFYALMSCALQSAYLLLVEFQVCSHHHTTKQHVSFCMYPNSAP